MSTLGGERGLGLAWRSLLALTIVVGLVPNLIGLAAGSLFPSQAKKSTRFNEDVLKRRLFEMREVIDQSYADNGRYRKNLKTLENDGYPARIPTDPFTGRNDS